MTLRLCLQISFVGSQVLGQKRWVSLSVCFGDMGGNTCRDMIAVGTYNIYFFGENILIVEEVRVSVPS